MQLNVLVFVEKRQQWYPIRDIICHEGVLYIKTLVSEIVIAIPDSLVWLSSVPPESQESRQPAPEAKAQPEPAKPTTTPPQFDSTSWQSFANEEKDVAAAYKPEQTKRHPAAQSTTQAQPGLESVARMANGRLYIKTALGVVVVEGHNLKYGFNRPATQT